VVLVWCGGGRSNSSSSSTSSSSIVSNIVCGGVVLVVVVVVVVVAVVDYSLRNNPKQRSSQLPHGGSLKSTNVHGDTFATIST